MTVAGGVFTIIANDGKIDKVILASKLLFQRISDAIYERTRLGKADVTPTLFDLERTHILYVNAHFKPYAAIGYEYSVTKPSSGTTTLGGSVQFSIPQFGDFFHDMVARVQIGQAFANSQTTPVQAANTVFPFNVADPDLLNGTSYNLVDVFGTTLVGGVTAGNAPTATTTYRNLVRYCEHPGDRIFSKVKFDVNGNNLDEYTQNVSVMLNKFTVMPHKRTGFDRMNGQQVPIEGLSKVHACNVVDFDANASALLHHQLPIQDRVTKSYTNANTGTAVPVPTATSFNTPGTIQRSATQSNQTALTYAKPIQTLVNGQEHSFLRGTNAPALRPLNSYDATNAAALTAAIDTGSVGANIIANAAYADRAAQLFSQYHMSQEVKKYTNGPQTPSPILPPLELWHKLKFWFNDDVRLSVPSVSIPYGQRFITMDLVASSSLIYEVPSLYVEAVQYNNAAGALVVGTNNNNVAGRTFAVGGAGVADDITTFSVIPTVNVQVTTGNPANAVSAAATYTGTARTNTIYGVDQNPITAVTSVAVPGANPVNGATTTNNATVAVNPTAVNRVVSLDAATATVPTTANGTVATNGAVAYAAGNGIVAGGFASDFRTYTPLFQRAGLAAEPSLTIELYINNIFVNPEVHDIFIARIGFALVRVYRTQNTIVKASTNEILLSALKWPVEYMFIGVQPVFNTREATTTAHAVTGGNVNTWRDWHRMTRQLVTSNNEKSDLLTCVTAVTRRELQPDQYFVPVSTVDSLSLVSHGIAIYNAYSDTFFNAYQPFHYGTCTIVTPEDTGAFFVNMALFPRTYQPSGHLNISRVRETYLNIASTYASAVTNCMAIIVAVCINFILISDGSAVLRFTT